MNLSADIKLTSVSSNDIQLLITIQLFKQTKMIKICFDWNQCKSLHKQSIKQSLSLNRTELANNSTKGNKYIFGHGLNSQIVQELSI